MTPLTGKHKQINHWHFTAMNNVTENAENHKSYSTKSDT